MIRNSIPCACPSYRQLTEELWQGASVKASDISSSMAKEGQRRYEVAILEGAQAPPSPPQFITSDLGSLTGSYDVVTCLDVMIHYPQAGRLSHSFICLAGPNHSKDVSTGMPAPNPSSQSGLPCYQHGCPRGVSGLAKLCGTFSSKTL
jgi:hypothetical protein